MIDVIGRRPELEKGLLEAMQGLASATVHEAMGRAGALDSAIKPLHPATRLCGRALTVACEPGDNLIVHRALRMAGPGDVLVVKTGCRERGFWGEVMSVAALARGAAGLVTDGAVRDSQAIVGRGFAVFAANVCILGTVKAAPGFINRPLVLGGVLIEPGDVLIGDADGVVCVPRARAAEALRAAQAREEKEAALMRALERGATTMDLLDLWPKYEALGLREADARGD